jgi:hypothetical protein
MYLPTDKVLYAIAEEVAADVAERIDWVMYARWDIDHIIADLDKLWPSND